MLVRKCDVCGKVSDEHRPAGWGGFVTVDGSKDACSMDCMLKGLSGPKVCTLGTLETIQALESQDPVASKNRS